MDSTTIQALFDAGISVVDIAEKFSLHIHEVRFSLAKPPRQLCHHTIAEMEHLYPYHEDKDRAKIYNCSVLAIEQASRFRTYNYARLKKLLLAKEKPEHYHVEDVRRAMSTLVTELRSPPYNYTQVEVGEMLGISRPTVAKHDKTREECRARSRRLTPKERLLIQVSLDKNYSPASLARQFGVTPAAIYAYKRKQQ